MRMLPVITAYAQIVVIIAMDLKIRVQQTGLLVGTLK